jgi:Glycosyltransferase family 87
MSFASRRLLLNGLSLIGLIVAVVVAIYYASDAYVYDAHAYWLSDGYSRASQDTDAFSYSPPVLLAFQAIRAILPWEAFAYVYTIAIALGIWVLAGPFTLLVLFIPHVATELSLGNIHIFLALVTVFGLRWPWLWSFVLLTKVTPGVGLVWFAVRREWRSLLIALGVTAAIALPTIVLYPDLWAGWIRVLTGPGAGADAGAFLLVRVVLGAAIVAVGAWRNWPWLVPVGSMLALPHLWSLHGYSMLVAVLWYVRKLPFVTGERQFSAGAPATPRLERA